MSRGPGRIERAIRELFDANPDLAFVTTELCEHCYPDVRLIKRKHQVAVLRAARKVATGHADWAWRISESQGGSLVFFNRASVQSRGMASTIADARVAYHSKARAGRVIEAYTDLPWTVIMERPDALAKTQTMLRERPDYLARLEQLVRWHVEARDGDTETLGRVQIERAEDTEKRHIRLARTFQMVKHLKVMAAAAKLNATEFVKLPSELGRATTPLGHRPHMGDDCDDNQFPYSKSSHRRSAKTTRAPIEGGGGANAPLLLPLVARRAHRPRPDATTRTTTRPGSLD